MIDVIGNAVRLHVLRRLALSSLTALELADELGVNHSSIHRHLVLLEQHGLVTAGLRPGAPSRPRGPLVDRPREARRARRQFWIRYATAGDPENGVGFF